MRISASILCVLAAALLASGCSGSGGGSGTSGGNTGGQAPPPPPPAPPPPQPAACDGFFPGMAYEAPATGPDPAGIYLASSDGCRSEFVYDGPDRRASARVHVTADMSSGVLVWSEDPGKANQDIVMQRNFSVSQDGILTLNPAVQILPRPGEEPVPGDQDFYFALDVWGGATADMRYLTVLRIQILDSANGEEVHEFLIYDLNDLTNVREVFRYVDNVGTWDCPAVPHPELVPACYFPGSGMLFNPSGTRLYTGDNTDDGQGQRWDAILRIDVDMSGQLADWAIGDPEIVVAAPAGEGPGGFGPRPGDNRLALPDPEIISSTVNTGAPTSAIWQSIFLDADQCVAAYAPLSDGNTAGQADLWMQCVDDRFLEGDAVRAWQTPTTVLTVKPPESPGIYRFHVSGPTAGTEEILLENGERPDTGL